jgi:hypothetical protein
VVSFSGDFSSEKHSGIASFIRSVIRVVPCHGGDGFLFAFLAAVSHCIVHNEYRWH